MSDNLRACESSKTLKFPLHIYLVFPLRRQLANALKLLFSRYCEDSDILVLCYSAQLYLLIHLAYFHH